MRREIEGGVARRWQAQAVQAQALYGGGP
jgi:hypothetical protein